MSAYETEYDGKTVSLHEEQIPENNHGARSDAARANTDPTNDGDELAKAANTVFG